MIGIRVDANEHIASGHLMRCITIANELRKKNEDVLFILSDATYSDFLSKKGYISINLDSAWNNWDDSVPKMIEVVTQKKISVLLIDSYQVTSFFINSLCPYVKIAYIDDEFKEKYNVSLIIAPTQSRDSNIIINYYKNTETKLLIGRDYLILRDEFKNFKKINVPKKNILITTGGSDNYHLLLKLITKLSSKQYGDYNFTFIAGMMNCDYDKIHELALGHKNISVIKTTEQMAKLFSTTYLAVSGGGTTIYELLTCKIPTICFALSDDQAALGERLDSEEYLEYVGDMRSFDVTDSIISAIDSLLSNPNQYNKLLEKIGNYSDGLGADRIANELAHLKEGTV